MKRRSFLGLSFLGFLGTFFERISFAQYIPFGFRNYKASAVAASGSDPSIAGNQTIGSSAIGG